MESMKARSAIVLFVLFLMSGWYSYQEFRYLFWGSVVDATVDHVEMRSERVYRRRFGSTTRQHLYVSVHFPNRDNIVESRSFRLPNSTSIQAQQTLSVQYLPTSTDMIRPTGSGNWISVLFFFGSLLAFAGMIVWAGIEANRPYGSSRVVDSDRPVRAVQPKKKKRVLKPLKQVDE
jgi:hypothetical protein